MHLFKKTSVPLLFLLAACQSPGPAPKPHAEDSLLYPYSPVYSNSYQPASGKLAQTVLSFWKEYETGDVQHTAGSFADSIVFILPDTILRGNSASVLEAFKKKRSAYTDMQCYVDSWMPLEETSHGDELVLLWGRQDGTTRQGKRIYRVLHEIWRFDRKGKVIQFEQYETHPH